MSNVVSPGEVTYDDILALPEHLTGEIVEGELFVNPRPAPRHSEAQGALYSDIYQGFHRGPGGWWIFLEPELHLGRDVLVPDIAAWRRERMAAPPETSYFALEPDWVCEVTSPSSTRLDRIKKLPRYARYGVQHAWIVDPLARSLEVYRLVNEMYSLAATHADEDLVRAEPFDVLELRLANLWLPTPPDPQSSR